MKVIFTLALFNLILFSSSYCAENFNNDPILQNVINAENNGLLGKRTREVDNDTATAGPGPAVRRRLNNNPGMHAMDLALDYDHI